MENENYIMLNGKKIELTPEQVKLIQADEPKKSPFDRAEYGYDYYCVDSELKSAKSVDSNHWIDRQRFEIGNYCTDEQIMEQHALHMQLNHLLWRYSMTHGGDMIDWDSDSIKALIYYDANTDSFGSAEYCLLKYTGAVPFANSKIAKAAIKEIIEPFVAEHPDFDVTKM